MRLISSRSIAIAWVATACTPGHEGGPRDVVFPARRSTNLARRNLRRAGFRKFDRNPGQALWCARIAGRRSAGEEVVNETTEIESGGEIITVKVGARRGAIGILIVRVTREEDIDHLTQVE
jgi:hypothetical protein